MINKQNYIEYIIDYYENNLSPFCREELLLFIEKHPEIKKEFSEYGIIYNTKIITPIFYKEKNNLLKSENDEFEQKCIDYIEGNISKSELLTIAKNNAEKIATIKSYEKTKLKIPIIKYPHKKSLYHYNTYYLHKIPQIAFAAAIIGFFYFLFLSQPSSLTYISRKTNYISENKTIKTHNNKILTKNINSIETIKTHKNTYKKTKQYSKNEKNTEKIKSIPVKKVEKINSINVDIIKLGYHKPYITYNTNIIQKEKIQPTSNNLLRKILLATVQYLFKRNIKIQQQSNNGKIEYFAFNSNSINIKIVKK